MNHRAGLTHAEVLACLFAICCICFLGVMFMTPPMGPSNLSGRMKCASNQRSLMQGMMVYAPQYNDVYPLAGSGDSDAYVIGFDSSRRGQTATYDYANNLTASMWILIRQGSAGTDLFICPSSGDIADDLTDAAGNSHSTEATWDFKSSDNLSYSPMNFFHHALRDRWASNGAGDWPMMGDDNNSTHTHRHQVSHGSDLSDKEIAYRENSDHHDKGARGPGQVIVFGDGHVTFFNDPFVGRDHDNAYAMIKDGENAPPSLKNDAGDVGEAWREHDGDLSKADDKRLVNDAFLIPLTGAAGGQTTLDPND